MSHLTDAQDIARIRLIEWHEAKKRLPTNVMPQRVCTGQDGTERILWALPDMRWTSYWLTDLNGTNPIFVEPS